MNSYYRQILFEEREGGIEHTAPRGVALVNRKHLNRAL